MTLGRYVKCKDNQEPMICKSSSTYIQLNTLQRQDIYCSDSFLIVEIFAYFEMYLILKWMPDTFQKSWEEANSRLGKLMNSQGNLFGKGQLETCEYQELMQKEHPQKAQPLSSKNGPRIPTLSTTV